MALKATKAEVSAVSIDDRAGGRCRRRAGAAIEARRNEMVFRPAHAGKMGQGRCFLSTPVKGAKVAARRPGSHIGPPRTLYNNDRRHRPGRTSGAKMARALGDAGIGFVG